MIEVNLLPGGKKRSSKGRGRGFGFTMPQFGGGAGTSGDPYILGAVAAGVISIAIMGWLFLGVGNDLDEVQVAVDEAVSDSVRFADIILRTDQLIARRDSIAQRVAIIQEIDAGRYIWPHVFDEIATAMPNYIWLGEILQTSGGMPMELRLGGQAGSNLAITRFMRNLEASSFLRTVTLERTEQAIMGDGSGDIVYAFDLTMTFEPPPMDELETIPLFDTDVAQIAQADTTEG